ncbi:MAG TPA: hypothetical protein VE465_12180 [Streptosporangiaceae bacterium]|jgi:hypothetical protein|nr:hypothetical protein [Streptosporangiaceae bacterium]
MSQFESPAAVIFLYDLVFAIVIKPYEPVAGHLGPDRRPVVAEWTLIPGRVPGRTLSNNENDGSITGRVASARVAQ